MSRVIYRYLFRQMTLAVLALFGGIIIVVWAPYSLTMTKLMVEYGISFSMFLQVAALWIPTIAKMTLPIALVVGVVSVLNRLWHDSELMVIFGIGVRPWDLLKPLMWILIPGVILSGVLSLYLEPKFLDKSMGVSHLLQHFAGITQLKVGTYQSWNDQLTFYVSAQDQDSFKGIYLVDTRQQDQPITIIAESGSLIEKEGKRFIVLHNGYIQQKSGSSLHSFSFTDNSVDLSEFMKEASTYATPVNQQSTKTLLKQLDAGPAKTDPGARNAVLAQLHKRLLDPLMVLVLPLIGFVGMTTAFYHRRGYLRVIMPIILLVGAVQIAYFVAENRLNRLTLSPDWVYGGYALILTVNLLVLWLRSNRQQFGFWANMNKRLRRIKRIHG